MIAWNIYQNRVEPVAAGRWVVYRTADRPDLPEVSAADLDQPREAKGFRVPPLNPSKRVPSLKKWGWRR